MIDMHPKNTPVTGSVTVTRFAAAELAEFGRIIRAKREAAEEDLRSAMLTISRRGSNGTEDTYAGYKGLDEGNPSLEREELMMLAMRQQKFIRELNLALERIRLGIYGICRVSGDMIPKERLLLVPHATMSISGKRVQAQGA